MPRFRLPTLALALVVFSSSPLLSGCRGCRSRPHDDIGKVEPGSLAARPPPSGSGSASSAPSAPPAPAPTATVSDARSNSPYAARCKRFCERAALAKCGPTVLECQFYCEENFAANLCREELAAAAECAEKEPVEHWTCELKKATVREEYCKAEHDAFMRCIKHHL